jgi:hypothetical protein
MSTKAQITGNITTKLASGALIPASSHRGVLEADSESIVNNFYGLKLSDTNASTNVFTENNAGKIYILRIIKQGGAVRVVGTCRNATGAVTGADEVWFTITNTEYQQQTSAPEYPISNSAGTGESIRCILASNSFASFDPVGIQETFNIDFEYRTNA